MSQLIMTQKQNRFFIYKVEEIVGNLYLFIKVLCQQRALLKLMKITKRLRVQRLKEEALEGAALEELLFNLNAGHK